MSDKSANLSSSNMSQSQDWKLIVEKDVPIKLRDGAIIYCDVLRPDCKEKVPALINIGPYQKDKLWRPPADLEEKANPYLNWETANPMWWCPRGYALIRVDSRGSGKSPGMSDPNSYQEGVDFYDAIEWAAKLPWCSGNIGALGVSYHANCQWRAANLQPPSLKAILPWEGRADLYRDQAYHGGIFAMGFISSWHNTQTAHHLLGRPREYNPNAFRNDMLWNWMSNNLDSDYWRIRSAQWEKITVPVFSAGNWGGFSLHLRGNIEGFVNAASKHKKLRVHTGSHFHPFHSEEGRIDQLRWFDYWLKNIDSGIMDEPPVKIEIRTGGSTEPYKFRFENEWPLQRTQWTKMHLNIERAQGTDIDSVEGVLSTKAPAKESKLSYSASGVTKAGVASSSTALMLAAQNKMGVAFETPALTEDTEVTGPLMMNLWVSSSTEDMDIMVTLRNIDAAGKDVCEVGQQGQSVPAVTKGWLRASHRKIDPARTLPHRPFHAHNERQWLTPGEIVECQIEIWPTCMVFKKGHKIRIDIQSRDGAGSQMYGHYHADYNLGAENTIYSGGDKPSYLLLPIIPAK